MERVRKNLRFLRLQDFVARRIMMPLIERRQEEELVRKNVLIVIIQVTNVAFCRKIKNNMVPAFRRDEAYIYIYIYIF